MGNLGSLEKRHRAAALQNLAEQEARAKPRQRLGVRQPYAAFDETVNQIPVKLRVPFLVVAILFALQ